MNVVMLPSYTTHLKWLLAAVQVKGKNYLHVIVTRGWRDECVVLLTLASRVGLSLDLEVS